MNESVTPNQTIVLLHGFAAHWTLMTPLAVQFKKAGYRTVNWGYKSWFQPIEFHANRLGDQLAELDADSGVESIHFVTHSMGCIVARAALAKNLPAKSGRWVMLAPPNRGSFLANSVPNFIKRRMRPIHELQATEDSYVNQLPMPARIETGVIQAAFDYIVAESLTHIPEERDRFVVPGLHSQMLFRHDVAQQTMCFLESGRFQAAPPKQPPSVRSRKR